MYLKRYKVDLVYNCVVLTINLKVPTDGYEYNQFATHIKGIYSESTY